MGGRRMAVATVIAAAIIVFAGCVPEPAPTPTPTGFASEDEAFAAAEATYRAYVDALNEVDLADPETFEDVYSWLAGDALADTRKSFSALHADRMTVVGESKVTAVQVVTASARVATIDVCLDVGRVDLLDEDGISAVPKSRPDRQPLRVTLGAATTATGLAITTSDSLESPICP